MSPPPARTPWGLLLRKRGRESGCKAPPAACRPKIGEAKKLTPPIPARPRDAAFLRSLRNQPGALLRGDSTPTPLPWNGEFTLKVAVRSQPREKVCPGVGRLRDPSQRIAEAPCKQHTNFVAQTRQWPSTRFYRSGGGVRGGGSLRTTEVSAPFSHP